MCQDEVTCERVQQALVDGSTLKLTFAENEHLAVCDACTGLLITRLLQQSPEIVITADFPARVRSRLADIAKAPCAHPRIPAYGFATAMALLMLLTLAWGVFAYFDPHGWMLPGRLALVLEYIIAIEIGAIALWLGLPRPAG